MKIFKWAVLLIFVAVIFIILLFPYEEYFKGVCQKIENEKQIKIAWADGTFRPWKIELNDVTCKLPDDSVVTSRDLSLQFDKITIHPAIIGVKIEILKDADRSAAVLRPGRVDLDLKNFTFPAAESKFGKTVIDLRGYFYPKKGTGAGKFILNLDNFAMGPYKEKVSLEGNYRIADGKTLLEFDVKGVNINGSGVAAIALSPAFESSPVTGTAYLHYDSVGKKCKITGTLGNIEFVTE